MNLRHILTFGSALLLGACDLSSTTNPDNRQAGTSSETQTSLQALADGLQTIVMNNQKSSAARSTAAVANSDTFTFDSYNLGMDWIRPYFIQRTQSWILFPGTDSAQRVSVSRHINSKNDWFDSSFTLLANNTTFRLSGSGRSRNGIGYEWKYVDSSDLPSSFPNRNRIIVEASLVIRFDKRWKVLYTPHVCQNEQQCDLMAVFQNGNQVGWMSFTKNGAESGERISVLVCKLFDLNRNRVHPTQIPADSFWLGESLGVKFGDGRIDNNGKDLLIPYRWQFLPGATKHKPGDTAFDIDSIAGLPRFTIDSTPSNPCRFEEIVPITFSSDSGAGTAIIHDVANCLSHNKGILDLQRGWSWATYSDSSTHSGMVSINEYPLTFPVVTK